MSKGYTNEEVQQWQDYVNGRQKKKYYVGVSILNVYEVEAKNKQEAESRHQSFAQTILLKKLAFSVKLGTPLTALAWRKPLLVTQNTKLRRGTL